MFISNEAILVLIKQQTQFFILFNNFIQTILIQHISMF